MGSETVWTLASEIAARAGTPIRVLAPPPPVTWIANDKRLFSHLVERVLGAAWLVESREAVDADDLALALESLVGRHQRVGLKRLRCASAMGNGVWESSSLRGMPRQQLAVEIRRFLERTEWDGEEPVLAVAWEEAALSPSTQLWVPATGSGPPRLDGVYEQILEGERRVFVGSRPARLPKRAHDGLAQASLALASALQEMGYVGRCSFDFLLIGEPEGEFALKFTECNGRWGGTSTPMALLDRIFPEGRPPYRAQDVVNPDLVGFSFRKLMARIGDAAFDVRRGTGRFIFYNTGPLAAHGKLDVIALGRAQEEAEEAMESELPRLLGL
jgi:hypothetical protein